MKDDRHIPGRSHAIVARQKIAFDHLDSYALATAAGDRLDSTRFTGGPGKAAQVTESTGEQPIDYPASDEARGPRH